MRPGQAGKEWRGTGPSRNRSNVSLWPSCSLLCKAIDLRLGVAGACRFFLRYLFDVARLVDRIAVFIDVFQTVSFNRSIAEDAKWSLQESSHVHLDMPEARNGIVITFGFVEVKTDREDYALRAGEFSIPN